MRKYIFNFGKNTTKIVTAKHKKVTLLVKNSRQKHDLLRELR